jgi:acetate---CoA ligase (ADP-forming)
VQAVKSGRVASGTLLAAQAEIQEIDLNPVTVYGAGQGVLALDALIVTDAPNGRRTP